MLLLVESRLVALEEFKYQRQTMETTIDELRNLISKKEDAYKKALDQMELALMFFKNRFCFSIIKLYLLTILILP